MSSQEPDLIARKVHAAIASAVALDLLNSGPCQHALYPVDWERGGPSICALCGHVEEQS